MTKELQKAMSVVEQLPIETQDAIAAALMAEVSYLQQSNLTPEQQAIVDERMAKPRNLAEPADVASVFAKY